MQTACIGPCFREPILLNIFHLAPSHSPILGLLLAAYGTSRRKTEQPIRNLLLDFKHGRHGPPSPRTCCHSISSCGGRLTGAGESYGNRSARVSLIAPCSRGRMGQSRNVRASFAAIVPAPQGSFAPNARPCGRPCALPCDGGYWCDRNRASQLRR